MVCFFFGPLINASRKGSGSGSGNLENLWEPRGWLRRGAAHVVLGGGGGDSEAF